MSTEVAHAPTPKKNIFETSIENVTQNFTNVCDKAVLLNGISRELYNDVKAMQRNYRNTRMKLQKKKRKRTNLKIHLPVAISNDLRTFLSLEKGTLLSKREAMKMISKYVKENNLQLSEDKRRFAPNLALKKIFNFKQTNKETLTFIEINKYVSHHFIQK